MGTNDAKKFELNTRILENFEEIMSTKLDEIEELKITSVDNSSKLLNIISLCANVKTLIIEGDQRINCDKILLNIFRPENLENLVLNNVKIPKAKTMKKYTNLKMISLSDIRFCNIREFFDGIINPENVEIIYLSRCDMANNSSKILEKFCNVKYLSMDNISNFQLADLEFLRTNEELLKVEILGNKIPVCQMNNLLDCAATKTLDLSIVENMKEKPAVAKLTIKNGRKSTLILTAENITDWACKIKFEKLKNVHVYFKKAIENIDFMEVLKKSKANVEIIVEDFSCVAPEQAQKMKEILKLKEIEFADGEKYEIDTYIEIRENIDQIINQVSRHVSQPEQFLEIYRIFGNDFELVEDEKFDLKNKTFGAREVSQVLRECLKCMNIEANVINGEYNESGKEHSWNQVKLQEKWYNVDLAADMKNIKKKKAKYCLLKDEDFIQTHTPKSGKSNYCKENFNTKLISVFFKTGLFKEKLFKSYIELVLEKLKNMLSINKQEKNLALPSGGEEKNKNLSKGK